MKRIALIFLSAILLVACNNKNNKFEPPEPPVNPDVKEISLNIHVPPNSLSTYAREDASAFENRIDSVFINLYQGSLTTPIHQGKFGGTDLTRISDSVVRVGYEVDNITTGTLTVQVFANKREPVKISNEIPIPAGTLNTSFYMSGKATLTYAGNSYAGEVHVVRNVAKLRINISKGSVVYPSDLEIDYSGVKIEVEQTPDSTSWFENTPLNTTFTGYSERAGSNLRHNSSFTTSAGGQIDSLYLYENLRSDPYGNGTNGTKIKVTIPTTSSEGNKSSYFTYTLYTNATNYTILRNYIYILDIKVRAQSLEPLITLDVQPWNDVNVEGSIHGTYLTMDASEIVFDSNGVATVNFCTDAQAVYFDYSGFNDDPANSVKIGADIPPVGIDETSPELAPDGFSDGRILLDKQHCGSFGFRLDPNKFPDFSAINFSGKICLRAGNIVKCLSFPAKNTYDAHFIVGETILNGETFTNATATKDNGSGDWLKISTSRLYTTAASTSYSGAAAPLYLHLDENLSGSIRTGSVTLVNGSVEKKIYISQLPALRVGRFGYTPVTTTDANIYTSDLYTEQRYEYGTLPSYINGEDNAATPGNALYNGRMTSIATFSQTDYTNQFNYQNTKYQAMNYCAFKNRDEDGDGTIEQDEIKWYLPAQAQLMAMWVSYESYKDVSTANFYRYANNAKTYADIHWCATDNTGYPSQAQYINFNYGNVGHYERVSKYWVRCVRDAGTASTSMVANNNPGSSEYPTIDFSIGLPASAYTSISKPHVDGGTEAGDVNKTVYKKLRVAKQDHTDSGVATWTGNFDCGANYSEPGATNTNWRLPTQRELQAIWMLQDELKSVCNTFEYLSDDYYWSNTSASTTGTPPNNYTNAWTIFGGRTPLGGAGNVPHQLKTTPLRVRCVMEIP
ncbi:MAG: DUF1566 domain-containing protein [Tannerella sp.]|jgi:hypothetical protein|nr:DUF1566 domain-containing protein [Tannerella sp.]